MLKQEELGQIGGVNRNTQGSYEKGERNPDAAYLVAVAAVGVDIMYVLSGARDISSADELSPAESRVLANYRALPEEDKASVRRLTDALAQSVSLRSETGSY
ncbi:transcriptional regulator [Metapseudomonas lalkuanensis]|uniref:Transcriptional regulator n=1 Tax=Metapseudomonas lalkuanensis TaxID=2604832 RepID=A0A5J6QNL2_9GAMM|nr:transcriptional regulator [Pseudomonas lalkuanensis]QEY63385.1 transcriptional regulator [Pseudomonas lalkuanensis]